MFTTIPTGVIVLAVIAVAIVALAANKSSKIWQEIKIPMPDTLRPTMLWGYYSSVKGSYEQTKDHINLFWYSFFFDEESLVAIMQETTCKIVIDLGALVSIKGPNGKLILDPTADSRICAFFDKLKAGGVLSKVAYLCPIDEPQLGVLDEAEHKKFIDTINANAAKYPELNYKLTTTYLAGEPFWNLSSFKVVSIDKYSQLSETLVDGEHARLVAALLPGQTTFLIPGCAFGEIPDNFLAYAESHPNEVEGMIPFVWFDDPEHKDVGYTGLVAAPDSLKNAWIAAAHTAMGH